LADRRRRREHDDDGRWSARVDSLGPDGTLELGDDLCATGLDTEVYDTDVGTFCRLTPLEVSDFLLFVAGARAMAELTVAPFEVMPAELDSGRCRDGIRIGLPDELLGIAAFCLRRHVVHSAVQIDQVVTERVESGQLS